MMTNSPSFSGLAFFPFLHNLLQSSPSFVFFLEFCSDVFFILTETIASQLEVVAKRPRKVKRSFTAEKQELTPDDFQLTSTQLFEIFHCNDPVVECHLSPNGTKFGVLEVRSLVLPDQKVKITELWPILDQFRVCFDSLSDEEVKKVLAELYKSMGNYTNTSSDEFKGILGKYFEDQCDLDTEFKDCHNQIQKQSNEKHDLLKSLCAEITRFVQKLKLLENCVSEISFDSSCSICRDSLCTYRFSCCMNGVCTSCGELFTKIEICPLCNASFPGIETGPNLQEDHSRRLRNIRCQAILLLISNILNPSQLTEVNNLKCKIIREVLTKSSTLTSSFTDSKTFSIQNFNYSFIQSQSCYYSLTRTELEKTNGSPLINSIVEEAITSAVTNHYEPTLVAASKLEEGIVDKSQKLLQSIRNNFSNHFCSDKTKPLLVCKSLHNGVLNCERSSKENSLMFSQIPPSFFDESYQSHLISNDDLTSKIHMPRVDSTYKVINFCTDEDFVLLILSTTKCTEIRLLKTDPNHPKEGFIKQYQKRSVLADFDPNTKTLVIYWMENSNHFISTFTIDHNTSQFIKPQRPINLSRLGRYHDSLLQSGDLVLLKLTLYSEGSKVVALDTTNHFVFIDFDSLTVNFPHIPLPQDIDRDSLWIRSLKSTLLLMIYKNMVHGNFHVIFYLLLVEVALAFFSP
ncbi:hypothetical protein GEMRC1_009013 [Eukaryota sp. GEM-RC1]